MLLAGENMDSPLAAMIVTTAHNAQKLVPVDEVKTANRYDKLQAQRHAALLEANNAVCLMSGFDLEV